MLVIHWLTNPEASHSLAVLVQYNHYLVVLLFLKLSFELRLYYCARTGKHSPTRNCRSDTTKCFTNLLFIKVFLGTGSSSLKVARLLAVVWNTVSVQLFVLITNAPQVHDQYRTLFNLAKISWLMTCDKEFDKY